MKTTKKWLFGLLALGFILAGCGDLGDGKMIDMDLHGPWKSSDPSVYSGTLVISYDTVEITGYGESQTPWFWDDSRRPFRDFQKGVTLHPCYTEDGKLFMPIFGGERSVPYEYRRPDRQDRTQDYIMFQFGDRTETMIHW